MDNFPGAGLPGNSHAAKAKKQQEASESSEAASEPKQIKQVVEGKVHKKTLGERFREMFASDDGMSFSQYLVEQVVIPGIKEVINTAVAQTLDGIKEGIEDRINGGQGSRTSRPSRSNRPVTNYNARYRSTSSVRTVSHSPAEPPRVIRRSNIVQDIILDNREHCDLLMEELEAVIDSVGHCTVGDLYSMTGIDIKKTDESWGWTDISGARTRLIPQTGEYRLMMPAPIPIESV